VLFKSPMGTQKNFFDIYTQFGHAPSKRCASPVLEKAEKYISVAVVNLRIDITVLTSLCQAQLVHPRPTLSC